MYSFKQLQKHKVLDKKRCVELVPFWGTQGNGVSISVDTMEHFLVLKRIQFDS